MSLQPKLIFVTIPPVGDAFHPISRRKNPTCYRPCDLKDAGTAETEWVGLFEEFLVGLYWKLGKPVPYLFREGNGRVRSLDAGCLKWLINRDNQIYCYLDQTGFIEAVEPLGPLTAKYISRRAELTRRLSKPNNAPMS